MYSYQIQEYANCLTPLFLALLPELLHVNIEASVITVINNMYASLCQMYDTCHSVSFCLADEEDLEVHGIPEIVQAQQNGGIENGNTIATESESDAEGTVEYQTLINTLTYLIKSNLFIIKRPARIAQFLHRKYSIKNACVFQTAKHEACVSACT